MKNIKILLMILLSMMVLSTHAQMLAKGVSKELADHRKVNISNVVYDLTFNIPSNLSHKVTGTAIISFELKEQEDLILDFQGEFKESSTAQLTSITARRTSAVPLKHSTRTSISSFL